MKKGKIDIIAIILIIIVIGTFTYFLFKDTMTFKYIKEIVNEYILREDINKENINEDNVTKDIKQEEKLEEEKNVEETSEIEHNFEIAIVTKNVDGDTIYAEINGVEEKIRFIRNKYSRKYK